MAFDNEFGTPPVLPLPLIRGNDVMMTFVYRVYDEASDTFLPAPWPDNTTVDVVIDGTPTDSIVGTGTVDDDEPSRSTVNIDYMDVDSVRQDVLWRAVIRHANGYDEVIMHGETVRRDGK